MKLQIRLATHFIIHQILLLFVLSIVAFFPAQFLHIHSPIFVFIIFLIYFMYCWFYAWYVGKPLFQIIDLIHKLSIGKFPKEKTNKKYIHPNHLYQEVFTQIEKLAYALEQSRQMRKQVQQQQRDWIAGISHDIKTPLSYILGYVQMLRAKHLWSHEEGQRFLAQIEEKTVHLQQLTEDFQFFISLEEGNYPLQIKTQNIVSFVRDVIVNIANAPQSDQYTFSLNSQKEQITTEFDATILQRILSNILYNAMLHNPPNTQIDVCIYESTSDVINIQIKDNGVGMDEETQHKLFHKYYRGTATHLSQNGTGLGMAIVKQLLTLHHANIFMKSRLGNGSSFTLTLPKQFPIHQKNRL